MNEKIVKQNGQEIYNNIKDIIDSVGPRLPGSEEEYQGAKLFAAQLKNAGLEPQIETFQCAPEASIAAVPALGYVGFAAIALFYLSPIASLILSLCAFIFAIFQVFFYTGLFDFLSKKARSQNVIAALEPKGEQEVHRTIMLTGHIDSSWCWKLSYQNADNMMAKTIVGVVSMAAIAIISIIALGVGATSFNFWNTNILDDKGNIANASFLIMYLLPIMGIPGSFWLSQFLTKDKAQASQGAMGNLSGSEIALMVTKFYKEHPEKMPKNTRIVCASFGAQESGLKGSYAYCKAHKNEIDKHCFVINIDSIRDMEHFNVITGDTWLMSHFDKELTHLALSTMAECGIQNAGAIQNPVGGCDSTPFDKSNARTITISALNPKPTEYYHTSRDTVDNLNVDTLAKCFEVVVALVPKIAEIDKRETAKETK